MGNVSKPRASAQAASQHHHMLESPGNRLHVVRDEQHGGTSTTSGRAAACEVTTGGSHAIAQDCGHCPCLALLQRIASLDRIITEHFDGLERVFVQVFSNQP
jgi:hypothetical protein